MMLTHAGQVGREMAVLAIGLRPEDPTSTFPTRIQSKGLPHLGVFMLTRYWK